MVFFAEHRRFIVVSVIASMAAITLGVVTWSAKQEADQLLVEKQNLQQAQSELQAKQAELEKSILRAKREAQASDDAVKDSQQYQQEQRARANRARGLINGMSAATSMKTAMTEFYFTEGKWPSSNQEFGEPDPSGFKADGVQSINVLPGGKIRLVLIGEAGKRQVVTLSASLSATGQVDWRCATADIPDIAQLLPTCSYAPR